MMVVIVVYFFSRKKNVKWVDILFFFWYSDNLSHVQWASLCILDFKELKKKLD